jgi:WD40 repeat protein
MTVAGPKPDDDSLVELLAAYDDALKAGRATPAVVPGDTPAEWRPRLQRGLACMHLLRQLLPRCPGPDAGSGQPLTHLGRFALRRELGRGGYGIVYLADDPLLGRPVALKVPRPEALVNPELRRRLLHEGRAAAGLDHPHLVPVYEVGEAGPLCYIAAAYCPGSTLAAWLRARTEPVPPLEAARLVAALAEAVQHAHGRGILHRDLKPGNVLLQQSEAAPETSPDLRPSISDYSPRLTDFGLAKALTEDGDNTTSGVILGTPAYMAPERFTGECDVRSDVYALGAILYELLALRPAFSESDRVKLAYQVGQGARPLRRVAPWVPADLETVVHKAMAVEPEERYPSAQDLADDLRRFLADVPVRARRATGWEHLRRWARRNRVVAALVGSVALLVLAIAVVSSVLALRLNAEAARAQGAERDAWEKLFRTSLAQAQASRWSGRIGQRFQALEALRQAASLGHALDLDLKDLLEVRNGVIACLALTDLQVVQQWPAETPHKDLQVAMDRSLERYASDDPQGIVHVREVGSHREVACLPAPPAPVTRVELCFSPDGRFLAVNYHEEAGRVGALVWNLSSGQAMHRFLGSEQVTIGGFSPDNRWVVTSRQAGSIGLLDLFGATERRLEVGLWATRLVFSPDGQQVAYSGEDVHKKQVPEVRLLDVATGAVFKSLPHPDELTALAWSPDGRLLAAGSRNHNVYVWDAWTWRPQAVLEGHQGAVIALAFGRGGEVLASSSEDGITHLWDPISGTALVSAPGRAVSFAGDGRRLAFDQGFQMGIWEVATGRECRQLQYSRVGNRMHSIATTAEALDFGWDGRLLVACGNDGVRFWDVATGEDIGFLAIGRHSTAFFDADSKRLFTYGRSGLRCWLVQAQGGPSATTLRIGPPQRLDVPCNGEWFGASLSHNGQLLAVNDAANHRVILLDLAASTRRDLSPGEQPVIGLDLSPDGRWLSLEGFHTDLRIWDVASTRPLEPPPAQMRETASPLARFSHDSRWLVGGGYEHYRIWRVGHWEEAPHISRRENSGQLLGPLAFSPDSRLLALARSFTEIALVDLATHQEVARLHAPGARLLEYLQFSPDGSQLAAATEKRVIQLWDLRTIRQELERMGLDWDLPPYPPARPTGDRLRVALYPDRIEAENLKRIAEYKCTWDMRDTSSRGRGAWSNDRELYGEAEPGGYLEVEFDAPQTGCYTLGITFTQAPDFGTVAVSVDGQGVGRPFDGYAAKILRALPTDCGRLTLAAGRHRLRFTAVGKQVQSSGYHFAVDCLQLLPLK